MTSQEVEELVVHLEKSMEVTNMERGIKLVGTALTNKVLNKWGIRNILRAAWKEMGDFEVKWAHGNTFIITVQDESSAERILSQVPWAVMKQNFSVKRWPADLAIEEIPMELVPFWVQIRGVPLCLCTGTNVRRLAKEIGEVLEIEDLAKARGFLRVRVMVNTKMPLAKGCWIPRESNKDSWIEFRYERLQDFCYKCGRIGHANTECSFENGQSSTAGYGEWTKTGPIREEIIKPKPLVVKLGERRHAGTIRGEEQRNTQRRVGFTVETERQEVEEPVRGTTSQVEAHNPRRSQKTWQRMKNRKEGQDGSSQQWVIDGNMAQMAQQVLMGIGCLGPQSTTIFNLPNPLYLTQADRDQGLEETGEGDQGPIRGIGGHTTKITKGAPNWGKSYVPEPMAASARQKSRGREGMPRSETSGQHWRSDGGWSCGAKRGSLETNHYSLKRNKLGVGDAEGKTLELPLSRKLATVASLVEEKKDSAEEHAEKRLPESTTKWELSGTKGGGGWPSTAAREP
ncbi:uncharacterized protein LOC125475077 [Pyrus x bretschneideri]|uniref:uncharacterized protein LOC125475077 n=1 Tax=Pyrus x bretschneideri TaxID=225117 RepID=UPI00203006C0|nr:uncharacterized protein LOC125475077 [Pyrus x bretschneideri]